MPLTLTVGEPNPIALVQKQASAVFQGNASLAIGLSLPASSQAGTMLLAVFANGGTPAAISAAPAGWTQQIINNSQSLAVGVEVWAYFDNPGGIQVATFTTGVGGGASGHISEWSAVQRLTGLGFDASGTAHTTAGTTITPTTTGNVVSTNEVGIAVWAQGAGVGASTFTSPTGWTRLADDGSNAALNVHLDAEYLLTPPAGLALGATMTSTTTTTQGWAAIIVLKHAPASVDETAYLKNDSQTIKLNTYDFGLLLGGRLLLESSTLDGYQLEDGSGVLLLDTYAPVLGDPVTLTTPTWSGRVVSTTRADIVDRKTNYALVTVAATNTAAAPGGTAPGDFSDTPAGGSLLMETGTDEYLQEDGVGEILLEGTSFAYRNLSVRVSQNQNGTSTTYGTLETFETGFLAGQAFLLTSSNLGYTAQSFTTTNVTTTFVGTGVPVYLIEFGDAYQTMQLAGGGVLTKQLSQPAQQMGVVMPGGVLGYVQVTADQATITAAVDLTGLTVAVQVSAGRRIRITAYAEFLSTIADDTAGLFIVEGATVLGSFYRILRVATRTESNSGVVILTPTTGLHTYKLQANRSGTGSVTMKADGGTSFAPAFILVEDVGT